MSLLEIENLQVSLGRRPILRDIDMTLDAGEVVGLVGESGSGKSMTALTVIRLLPRMMAASGRVTFDGIDLLAATEDQMNALRGDDIGMVFQEPMTALNPVKTIGEQVAEGIRWHTRAGRAEAEARAAKMLDRVGLPSEKFPLSRYPHQLSGGQRQRVVIAIAAALKPKLLIADEPTTALDVVLQAQILDLLRELVHENRSGLLLISHDLAVVTEMSDRIVILRHGAVMETGETAKVLSEQVHPYTRQLAEASVHVPEGRRDKPAQSPSPTLRTSSPPDGRRGETLDRETWLPSSTPLRGRGREQHEPVRESAPASPTALSQGDEIYSSAPLLRVANVVKDYPGERISLLRRGPPFRAVDDVSFTLRPHQSIALVGRSGCGKSTLARMILALDTTSSGSIELDGTDLAGLDPTALKPHRRKMQVVFQDPFGSFDPRHSVERLVSEPLFLLEKQPSAAERRELVKSALHEVGLSPADMEKYPHEFSGGQRQRLSIARALITRPRLIVADEPVSALDVSIRAQVLDLFAELNARLGVAYLFITHDLTVARAITDEVMVMSEGRIVERGATRAVLDNPQSEAGRQLVDAAPDLRRAIARKLGEQG